MKIKDLSLVQNLTGQEVIPCSDATGNNQAVGMSLDQIENFCSSSAAEVLMDWTYTDYLELTPISVDTSTNIIEIDPISSTDKERFRDLSYPYETADSPHYRCAIFWRVGQNLSNDITNTILPESALRIYWVDDSHFFLSTSNVDTGTNYIGDGIAVSSRYPLTMAIAPKIRIVSLVNHEATTVRVDASRWKYIKIISDHEHNYLQSRYDSGNMNYIIGGTAYKGRGGMIECNYTTLTGYTRCFTSVDIINDVNTTVFTHVTAYGKSGTNNNCVVIHDASQFVKYSGSLTYIQPIGYCSPRVGGSYNVRCVPDGRVIVLGICKK